MSLAHRCIILLLLSAGPALAADEARPGRDAQGEPLPAGALARFGTTRFRAAGWIEAVALSPDGTRIALGLLGGPISLLDAATGRERRRIEEYHSLGERTLAFSPDGKTLVAGTPSATHFFDVETGEMVGYLDQRGTADPGPLALSADGKLLALGAVSIRAGRPAALWDVASRTRLREFSGGHDRSLFVALSRDGKGLATWGHTDRHPQSGPDSLNTQVHLWDTASGKRTHTLRAGLDAAVALAVFAPNGKTLAVVDRHSELSFWDTTTGKELRRHAVPLMGIKLARYSPDGKTLVLGGLRGAALLWDVSDMRCRQTCPGPGCKLEDIVFLPGGKVLACGASNRVVVLWEVPSGQVLTPREGPDSVAWALAFAGDGKHLLAGGSGGLRFWHLGSGKVARHQRWVVESEDEDEDRILWKPWVISPDGRHVVWIAGENCPGWRLREAVSGREVFNLGLYSCPDAHRTAFTPDGRTLAMVAIPQTDKGEQGRVGVWEVGTGRRLPGISFDLERQGDPYGLAVHGQVLAVSAVARQRGNAQQPPGDGGVRIILWDLATGKERYRFRAAGSPSVTLSPDGTLLAGPDADRKGVGLWDTTSGQPLPILMGEDEQVEVSQLAFAPDGRTLAAAVAEHRPGAGRILVWELASGRLRAELRGDPDGITALAFSPDSRVLATGGADTTVFLWDLAGKLDTPPATPLTAREREALWADLSSLDARRPHRAMCRLAAASEQAVEWLREHLPPAQDNTPSPEEIQRLIAKLDNEAFATREQASARLAQGESRALAAVRWALAAEPSAEKRRRLLVLVEVLTQPGVPAELLRAVRAVEVLERLGTTEARRHLEALSKGHAGHRLTREAQAALGRLARQP
jgi:WD40 repeat protein